MTVIIRSDALIDGLRAEPVAGAQVEIEPSGRIGYVGPKAGATPSRDQAVVYDLGELTLLPGLIDCHVHPTDVSAIAGTMTEPRITLNALGPLRVMLEAGITSARVPGAPGITSLELRSAQADGRIAGPRLRVAGRFVCPTGGHCHAAGIEADGSDGVRRATRELFKQGADFIKVTASGGGLTPGTRMGQPTFTEAELRAAAEEAAQHESYVTAHCHSSEAMRRVVSAGIRMIEHATFTNAREECEFLPDLADQLADTGTVVCPTIAVNANWLTEQAERVAEMDEAELTRYTKVRDRWLRRLDVISELHQRGVVLIIGTDAPARGVPWAECANSIGLHVRAGVPVMDAIKSATCVAADHIGLGELTGRLATGFEADIIAVDGDPLTDLSALERVRFVMQRGTIVMNRTGCQVVEQNGFR